MKAATRCPLCGGNVERGTEVCGSCPMSHGCDIDRCSRCGYQLFERSAVIEWLARLWKLARMRGDRPCGGSS